MSVEQNSDLAQRVHAELGDIRGKNVDVFGVLSGQLRSELLGKAIVLFQETNKVQVIDEINDVASLDPSFGRGRIVQVPNDTSLLLVDAEGGA